MMGFIVILCAWNRLLYAEREIEFGGFNWNLCSDMKNNHLTRPNWTRTQLKGNRRATSALLWWKVLSERRSEQTDFGTCWFSVLVNWWKNCISESTHSVRQENHNSIRRTGRMLSDSAVCVDLIPSEFRRFSIGRSRKIIAKWRAFT